MNCHLFEGTENNKEKVEEKEKKKNNFMVTGLQVSILAVRHTRILSLSMGFSPAVTLRAVTRMTRATVPHYQTSGFRREVCSLGHTSIFLYVSRFRAYQDSSLPQSLRNILTL